MGYYDEDGYWHRDPDQPQKGGRGTSRPIRDPYYDQYREQYYDPYGRPVQIRRVVRRKPQYRRVTTSQLGMFSGTEIREILIATLVLAVAFTLVLTDGIFYISYYFPVLPWLFFLSLIATATAFTTHEVAHKFMAQRHGLPAEFVLNPTGIMVALATAAIIGFLFALPGAVVFSGAGADRKVIGKVGAAGPAVNALLAAVFFPLMLFVMPALNIVVLVNAFLGLFNMIPWGMFDGLKVWRWNPGVYILLIMVLLPLLIMAYMPSLFFA